MPLVPFRLLADVDEDRLAVAECFFDLRQRVLGVLPAAKLAFATMTTATIVKAFHMRSGICQAVRMSENDSVPSKMFVLRIISSPFDGYKERVVRDRIKRC